MDLVVPSTDEFSGLAPEEWREMLSALARPNPITNFIKFGSRRLDVLNALSQASRGVKLGEQRNLDLLKIMNDHAPVIMSLFVHEKHAWHLQGAPLPLLKLIEFLHAKLQALYFLPGLNSQTLPVSSDADSLRKSDEQSGKYYAFPQTRKLRRYAADGEIDEHTGTEEACERKYEPPSAWTHGVLVFFCSHWNCVGFEILREPGVYVCRHAVFAS